MDIAVPVRSPTNNVTGVLAAHLMADWLIDVNNTMRDASPVETLILTSKGQLIVGPAGLMGGLLDEPTFGQVRKKRQSQGGMAGWRLSVLGGGNGRERRLFRVRLDRGCFPFPARSAEPRRDVLQPRDLLNYGGQIIDALAVGPHVRQHRID